MLTNADLRIRTGESMAMFAFDIAFAIDLDRAAALLSGAAAERASIRSVRRSPAYFDYRPLPIRVTFPITPIELSSASARWATLPQAELLIYDFGAVSITFRVPLSGPLSSLVELSAALYDATPLIAEARRQLAHLTTLITPALDRPHGEDAVEDYVVHQIESIEGLADPSQIARTHAGLLARVLRAELGEISEQETGEALAAHTSYRPTDAAIVDWNAAVLLDSDAEDVRAVLEFANVESLELRMLDDRLDRILEDAYRMVSDRRAARWFRFPISSHELDRVSRLQMDSAILYEGINNAIKLVGDQYLARVYRQAAAKLHLPERDASIERKLQTLDSIYAKLQDRQAALRLEVLEWIVIILILISIVLPFLPWFKGK